MIILEVSSTTLNKFLEYRFVSSVSSLAFLAPLTHSWLHLTHKSVEFLKKHQRRLIYQGVQRVPRNRFKVLSSTDAPVHPAFAQGSDHSDMLSSKF